MRLSASYDVYRYYQVLIFLEFISSFFKIHNYLLRNYNINIDKNINLEIIYKIYFYNKRSYSRYIENSIDLNDFIIHFSHRYEESYLLNF